MAGAKQRFQYRRERADGKSNDTTCGRTFEKWLREKEPGDVFFVAKLQWVECVHDRDVDFGGHPLPHVSKVADVDGTDNGTDLARRQFLQEFC